MWTFAIELVHRPKLPEYLSKRGLNRVSRNAWAQVGLSWAKRHQGRRFRVRYGDGDGKNKYGFQSRSIDYVRRQKRKHGQWAKYLVNSGELREAMKFPQIRPYPNYVMLDYVVPWYAGTRPAPYHPNIRQELFTVPPEEIVELSNEWATAMANEVKRETGLTGFDNLQGRDLAAGLGIID